MPLTSPLQEGNPNTTNHSLSKIKQHPKTPLSRGAGGVSRPCTASQNQKQSLTFDRYLLAPLNPTNLAEEYLCLIRTSHRNTPLNPLSGTGKPHTQPIHYQQENSTKISPLERGRGCVTPKHSHRKTKATTQSQETRPHQTVAKSISSQPAPLSVTHPSIPSLGRGNLTLNPLIIKNKAASKTSPLERGQGCVTPEHSLLKSKATTQSRQIPPRNTKTNFP